ncbi:MAG: STAS-like domain-containing protein [Fibromonadales bacterium]|nr:STAS-like domain-containing protein [Fibromonadales bacterium]
MKKIELRVYQIVGNEVCVSADDGHKVYESIKTFISEKKKIVLSFQNVTMLTSAFLNTAIGQLYGSFSEKDIKLCLSVSNLPELDLVLLKRVVENAKCYYSDPQKMEQTIKEVLD